MYKKFIMQLCLCNLMVMAGSFCVKSLRLNQVASTPAFKIIMEESLADFQVDRSSVRARRASSGQRIVDYTVMEKEYKYSLSENDYQALLKIVQAEAGNEDEEGKMLVAGVVLNRVNSGRFPDTVLEVVMQQEKGRYQFSPVANGTYQRVKVTQDTVDAVDRVLKGEDLTQGALYFAARKAADPDKMKWFDCSLVKLFEHGGHEFFTNG